MHPITKRAHNHAIHRIADKAGSGDGTVWVTNELDVTITGSGNITYRGEPAITQTITGSGYVTSVASQSD